MKRIFDCIISFLGLVFLLPFFLINALIIKADNKGPIFFKQKRVGKNGRIFLLYKFRTMKVLDCVKEGNFEPGNLSRITKVGKVLRRTKIDELPQLFNILKGDMSFVGPRPEVAKFVAVCPKRWERILSVRPGITDNSSILFRNEESLLSKSDDPEKVYKEIILPRKLELYEYYVENNSFIGDLKIIFKTIFSILFN